jgi:hypothetical protein
MVLMDGNFEVGKRWRGGMAPSIIPVKHPIVLASVILSK